MTEQYSDEIQLSSPEPGESPLHGYRGAEQNEQTPSGPAGLTIAISREAGSRGAPIAKRAGDKLGWDVYTQDLMDFVAQDASVRKELLERLPASAYAWVDAELQPLLENPQLARNPLMADLIRLVLSLAAHGNVILLGRGAGYLLPSRSTLHVRLVAPLGDRVAYMSQWLRLTEEEAAEQVHKRDQRRSEFVTSHFHRKPSDAHAYDLILNTSLLGEERCADLIVAAAKAKMSAAFSFS